MEFIYPYLLWGGLAVIIPVAIHFWYQKKGKTIAWAASEWLTDQTSLQHRGMRLDEIPLLLLRCGLLIILVLAIARPFFRTDAGKSPKEKIHLVEPDKSLVENFRFELESALNHGERVYWLGGEQQAITDISNVPEKLNPELYLQESIERLGKGDFELDLYVLNSKRLAENPPVYVPENFKLYSLPDSAKKITTPYFNLEKGKKLFVGRDGKLKVVENESVKSGIGFTDRPVHEGPINVLLLYANAGERQTVTAALEALKEVYSIPFVIDTNRASRKKYELIVSDHRIGEQDDSALYIVSGAGRGLSLPSNTIIIPDSLRINSSEFVESGQLPEWLGDVILSHYGMKNGETELSQKQLQHVFVTEKPADEKQADPLFRWLLLCFVAILCAERWISLQKNRVRNYA